MCHKPAQLRLRAEELRTIADGMTDEECKRQLTRCANEYDEWASKLENIIDNKDPQ